VLYNPASADGVQIANYYAQVHPGVSLLPLSGVSQSEQISADQYLTTLRPQVLDYLGSASGAQITTLVTTKGLPLRIYNSQANPGTYPGWRGQSFGTPLLNSWWKPYSSLESELTRIDRISTANEMGDQAYFLGTAYGFSTPHQAENPYFGATTSFDRVSFDGMRLTARLDGFSASDVIGAIDRAQHAILYPVGYRGTVVIDNDPTAPAAQVNKMPALRDKMASRQQPTVYDNTGSAIVNASVPVIGYVSHGVNNGSGALQPGYIGSQLNFNLAKGAVFDTWESYNAYSFTAGGNRSGQGLIGDWLAAGGTAGVGCVEEPLASASNVTNEDLLFDGLVRGMTFAEAAWSATKQLSFVNTVVGDPLMRWLPVVAGDADCDGRVGLTDLALLSGHWNVRSGMTWATGDFNGDGVVTVGDLSLLSSNWGWIRPSSAPAENPTTVPDPATLSLLSVGAVALLRRRK
jgi:uncharacterized protein (TIGR03790 family)